VVVLTGDGPDPWAGDAWEYDGTDWVTPSLTLSPTNLSGAGLAYDAGREVSVLFGGAQPYANGPDDTTWEYEINAWSQADPDHRPTRRSGHAMAYDSVREVVVFGGEDFDTQHGFNLVGDTWEYGFFTQSVTAGFVAAPLTVTFSDQSSGAVDSHLWDYGDEITSTTSTLTHTHQYTVPGVYSVTQTVTGLGGSDALTRTGYITVSYPIISRVSTYTYDPLYRLTGADYSSGEQFEYAYDAVGNRQALAETLGVTPTVHRYVYDQANRLTSVDGITYTWDANGNLLSDGVRTFTYDAANRLTSVTSGTLTTTFEYDGLGNRVAQTVDGATTTYTLDVAGGLPEVIVATTGGASTHYVQIQGQVLAQQESGAWAYVLPDHLGSVRQLVGADGQVTLAQSFDPFGVPFEASGSGESDFGYTGEWWGNYNELLYLRARYYDPRLGRFVSADTVVPAYTNPQQL
jgi:RHS repeat-associated protein